MLFGNRKEETSEKYIEKLDKMLEQKLEEKLGSLGQEINGIKSETQKNCQQTETLIQDISRFQVELHKHDMSIEDLMEEWEERSSDEREARSRLQELEQSEKALLNLFEAYQEQFYQLRKFAAVKEDAWTEQLALMDENLEKFRQQCNISMIEKTGILVNYNLHEVIEVKETDDWDKDSLIADICRCGYIYKGKIIKKAQVTVYRGREQGGEN